MKWLIGTLVVLNLLAGLYAAVKQKPEQDLTAHEVNAEQLKLLPADWKPEILNPDASAPLTASAPLAEAASAAGSVPPPQVASAPLAAANGKADKSAQGMSPRTDIKPDAKVGDKPQAKDAKDSPPPPAKPQQVAVGGKLCRSWGPLTPQQLQNVQAGLPALQLASVPSASVKESLRGSGRIWVHYPPLATQAETQTLVSELRSKGFDSYIVQTDGPFRNHLSLGLFGKQAAADALIKRLKAAGYDKAQQDVRGEKVQMTTLSFRNLNDAGASRLKSLQQQLLPGIALQDCQ